MKLGVIFPQTEIGSDPIAIRDYAQAVEGAGYEHLLVYDHVLGAPLERFTDANIGYSTPPYTERDPFHEVFVLFGYLAAITERLELVTGVLVLPQRPTALVAKQAAAIDVLSSGRLRLGVGIGWNFVEYEALGANYRDRAARLSEQVALLRAFWTEPVVTFQGRWHQIDRAGINPLPVQRPIPVWMGGLAEAVLKRTARIADGWFPPGDDMPPSWTQAARDRLHAELAANGRDPAAFGLEARTRVDIGGPAEWAARAAAWRAAGATHLSVNTMEAGFSTPQQHIDAVLQWKRVVDGG